MAPPVKRCAVTRSIAATPERVWELLTDASSYQRWNPAVVSIEGPIALGGTVRLVSVASPKRTFSVRVSALEPARRMVWSDGMPLGLFKGERTYLVEPVDGGARFSMSEEFSGPMSGLICRSIPDLGPSFDQFADGLKSAAEQPGG